MTKSGLAGEIEQRMHVIRHDNVKTFTNEEVIEHIQSIVNKYKAPDLAKDSVRHSLTELEARVARLENPFPRPITAAGVLELNYKRIEAMLNKEPDNGRESS